MEEQLSRNDGYAYSLDAMWRAVGSPPGRSPAEWLELTSKLVEGLRDYLLKISALDPMSTGSEFADDPNLTWKVTPESIRDEARSFREWGMDWEYDPFRRDGDTMGVYWIAHFYAVHLDAMVVN
jgi:hypothetical protein